MNGGIDGKENVVVLNVQIVEADQLAQRPRIRIVKFHLVRIAKDAVPRFARFGVFDRKTREPGRLNIVQNKGIY